MKKVIFGIFAHPDDEAFGASGTLLKEVREGADLHLITLTLGEAGQNPDNVPNLAEVREQEWRVAGGLIGATSMHTLRMADGHLDNIAMQQASTTIKDMTREILASYDEPIEAEFMTIDQNGITGHIDHIVAARSASYVFHRMREEGIALKRIRYVCVTRLQMPDVTVGWIYADKGRNEIEISEIVDARAYREEIIQIMRSHHTQRLDCEDGIARHGDSIGLDHFIVVE